MTRHIPTALMFLAGVVAALLVVTVCHLGMAHATPLATPPATPPGVPLGADANTNASALPAPPDAVAPAGALHDPVTDPTGAIDDIRAARRLGWPIAVGVIAALIALALGTAGARISWLSWLARGSMATLLGAVSACGSAAFDAAVAGGSMVAVAAAAIGAALAFWRAHRTAAPERAPERGAVHPLLAILLGVVAVLGAGMAWSCSSAQRRAVIDDVVDCTIGVAGDHAGEYEALLEHVIRAATSPDGHVDWPRVRAAAIGFGGGTGACALAAAVGRMLDQQTGLAAAPPPTELRAGFEQLRRELWGGRRYRIAGGAVL